jgi:uncharacterized membrane protein
MRSFLESPARTILAGFAVAALILVAWVVIAGVDAIGFQSFLLRFAHVLSAVLWVGMIWFVNLIQLRAVAEADEAGRAAILRHVAPRTAALMRHASHATIVSGLLLLVTAGYLLDRMIFTSEVYIPPLRNLLVWGGALVGIVMWAFLNLLIWPAMRIVSGATPASPEDVVDARDAILTYARLNLLLSIPVTFAMIAAAHLY